MTVLDDATIEAELHRLDGWRREGDAIVRSFRFDSFRAAIRFIVRVADEADRADHHPEMTNVYADVVIRLWSHDAGGITQRDVDLAHRIDAVVAEEG